MEEFDEREFLFGVQIVAYMSNLGRFLLLATYWGHQPNEIRNEEEEAERRTKNRAIEEFW
jgi:hypothetical protein